MFELIWLHESCENLALLYKNFLSEIEDSFPYVKASLDAKLERFLWAYLWLLPLRRRPRHSKTGLTGQGWV